MTNYLINMNRGISLLFSFVFLLFSFGGFAQQNDKLITGNFQNVTFNEFVQKIEAQTDYHFYYQEKQFDSTSITISVTNAHLPSILDKVFNKTGWHYVIDKNNNVFITQGFTLSANLPYGFFNGEIDTSSLASNNESEELGYINKPKKVKQDISIENKVFEIGIKRNGVPKGKVNIAGYVRDAQNGEALSGAVIIYIIPRCRCGLISLAIIH
ncbi:MAG: hypothetical protein ABI366_06740 [Ginsengibacter sp.]